MAGKRKIVRQRTTNRKTKSKKTTPEKAQSSTLMDFGFTKEEEEEPLSVHIKPSPKKSPRARSPRKRETKGSPGPVTKGKKEPTGDDEKENIMGVDTNGDDNADEDNQEELKSKYEVRERVLARDEDGILYYGNIRRKMYGINHQKTISCLGIFDLAPDEISGEKKDEEQNDDGNDKVDVNEWHYFVHYEGWKTLWDRWISETDILDITPENLERMKEISKSHRDFQLEFKERTKKKKIDNGGLFLQQWKQRLDALNRRWDEKLQEKENGGKGTKPKDAAAAAAKKKAAVAAKKKKNSRSPKEILRDRSKLAVESCLTTRQPSHIQAIPLSFGLKRILVEDWENLNNGNFAADNRANPSDENMDWDMVHVLPAKVTIRDALSLYLKEKGIAWDEKSNKNNAKKADPNNEEITEIVSTPKTEEKKAITTTENGSSNDAVITPIAASPSSKQVSATEQDNKTPVKKDSDANSNIENGVSGDGKISIQLEKEWTDMANGIVLYFEQALMSRLLYPSEISQLLVMEDNFLDDNNGETKNEPMPLKADIYGCEHLLRLLSALPRILDQQLQDSRKRKMERKQKIARPETAKPDEEDVDQDDAFVEIGSMILAKLQDLSRFLQKNQSALFRSMYRKKNEQEIKRDVKIQKRQEQRLKRAAAAAAAASQSNTQESEDQDE